MLRFLVPVVVSFPSYTLNYLCLQDRISLVSCGIKKICIHNQKRIFFPVWNKNNRAESKTLVLNYFKMFYHQFWAKSMWVKKYILISHVWTTCLECFTVLRGLHRCFVWIVHRVKSHKNNQIHLWDIKNIKYLLIFHARRKYIQALYMRIF